MVSEAGGVAEEGVGDAFNLGCHGRREKQRLTGKRRQAKDAFDVGDETHVQHPVGFVHDHDFHVRQDQLAALEMVQQTARRGNQHVDALVDQRVLFLERHAADQQRLGQFQVFGIGVEVFGNLCGQLAGGAQHQAASSTALSTLGFSFSSENFVIFVRSLRTLTWPAAALKCRPAWPKGSPKAATLIAHTKAWACGQIMS